MGFLRKIGRKIKKGVKKLFSSKIGSFIGSIALGMIMGPVVSRAFNGIKGVFTGAAQKGTETLVQEGVQKVVEEGAKETIKDTTVNIVSDSVTGSLEKLSDTSDLFVDFGSKGSVGLKGEATTAALKEKIVSTAATGPTVGQQIRQNFVNLGTGVKDFASDPFGKTKEYVGGDFIPDVARSVGQQYVMGAIQGEPEEQTAGFGRMPQVGSMEASQNAYVAEVRNQIPNLQATNFNQLNQSLLYGTLSPQYLMGQMG
jgi:hypothetical protein